MPKFFSVQQDRRYYYTISTLRVEEDGSGADESAVQHTVYRLKIEGEYEGKTVLAIRGTWTLQSMLQDLSLLDVGQVSDCVCI